MQFKLDFDVGKVPFVFVLYDVNDDFPFDVWLNRWELVVVVTSFREESESVVMKENRNKI
jgi:hypothetical protein